MWNDICLRGRAAESESPRSVIAWIVRSKAGIRLAARAVGARPGPDCTAKLHSPGACADNGSRHPGIISMSWYSPGCSLMALVSVWLLAGCGAPSSNSSNTAEIAARVNGTTITIPQLNAATPQATDGSPDVSKAKPAAVLQHMVAEELLVQQ